MPLPQSSPALPSSAQPSFPTTRPATFLHGSCLSQNSNGFNTLMHCWKTPAMLPWNRTLHLIRAHNRPLCPPGMVFPNILSPRPQPPKATWSSPWLGPFWLERAQMEAEQMLMATMHTMTRGSHNTKKQKGSHQWHHLFPDGGTGRALLYRTQTAFPTHITATKANFCSASSSKTTDFFALLAGQAWRPHPQPLPTLEGIMSINLHTYSKT